MKVYEYIDFLVNGEISHLAFSNVGDMTPGSTATPTAVQLTNRDKIRSFINLANIELHKKFNILQKDMELDFALDGEEFNLADDFLHAISCRFLDGEEIAINNDKIKLVNNVEVTTQSNSKLKSNYRQNQKINPVLLEHALMSNNNSLAGMYKSLKMFKK